MLTKNKIKVVEYSDEEYVLYRIIVFTDEMIIGKQILNTHQALVFERTFGYDENYDEIEYWSRCHIKTSWRTDAYLEEVSKPYLKKTEREIVLSDAALKNIKAQAWYFINK